MTDSIEADKLRADLKKYNWSSDKDYQIAMVAFKELFTAQHEKFIEELIRKLSRQAIITLDTQNKAMVIPVGKFVRLDDAVALLTEGRRRHDI